MYPRISQLTAKREVLVQRSWGSKQSTAVSLSRGKKSSEFKEDKLWRHAEGNPEPSAEYACEETTRARERNARKGQVENSKDLAWSNGNSGGITVARASLHSRLNLKSFPCLGQYSWEPSITYFTKSGVVDSDLTIWAVAWRTADRHIDDSYLWSHEI